MFIVQGNPYFSKINILKFDVNKSKQFKVWRQVYDSVLNYSREQFCRARRADNLLKILSNY